VGHSSHRKRAPLPPQATTFLTSSVAPEYARNALTGGAEYNRDRGRKTSRQPTHYPAPINTSMNVDDEEGRTDRYSRSRGRTADYMKAPSQRSSGTNNIPIGNKRSPYNADARPPPSTLIDPAKARELLPPGKESYERPADLEISDAPQVKTANDNTLCVSSPLSGMMNELGIEPEETVFKQEKLERPQVLRQGVSLLDRLSTGNSRSHDSAAQQQSLWDRLIPSKRDFEDMGRWHATWFRLMVNMVLNRSGQDVRMAEPGLAEEGEVVWLNIFDDMEIL